MNLLLPVGGHLFTPEALQKAAAEAMADHPGAERVLKGTVDANGISTVLVIGAKDGHVKVSTAFSHDWQGHNMFGASGSIAW